MDRPAGSGKCYAFALITVALWSTSATLVKSLTEGIDSLCLLRLRLRPLRPPGDSGPPHPPPTGWHGVAGGRGGRPALPPVGHRPQRRGEHRPDRQPGLSHPHPVGDPLGGGPGGDPCASLSHCLGAHSAGDRHSDGRAGERPASKGIENTRYPCQDKPRFHWKSHNRGTLGRTNRKTL